MDKQAEQDLIDADAEKPWPTPYPRPYEEDFRAPLEVPSDHPTFEQELQRRRSMIYALNRQMKLRDDALWRKYAVRSQLERCLETRYNTLARRGFMPLAEQLSAKN